VRVAPSLKLAMAARLLFLLACGDGVFALACVCVCVFVCVCVCVCVCASGCVSESVSESAYRYIYRENLMWERWSERLKDPHVS